MTCRPSAVHCSAGALAKYCSECVSSIHNHSFAKMTVRGAPYGRPENFRESLTTPTATLSEFFNGLLFQSILWMYVQNLELALPFPEKKIGQSLNTPTLTFLQNSYWALFGCMDPVNVPTKFDVPTYVTRSWDNSEPNVLKSYSLLRRSESILHVSSRLQ